MRPRTVTQTDRHTDARDHNTFRVVYDDAKCNDTMNGRCGYIARVCLHCVSLVDF